MDADLLSAWTRSAPHLERALRRWGGGHTLDDARSEVAAGRALLWPGRASAAVTENARDFHIWLAGGDLRELQAMERDASAWAKAHGYDRVTLEGRKGWARALAGYRPLLVKDL